MIMLPEISGADIERICSLMRIADVDSARREFLGSMETLDVAACPGSGKTTLVVAKLAILGSNWRCTTKGVCVLSHTNAARLEIEARLDECGVGDRILAYPHYVDTIHGFVNRFLAVPWLIGNGYPSPTVDDDLTTAVRTRFVDPKTRRALQTFLEKKRASLSGLRIVDRGLGFVLGGKQFPASEGTASHAAAKEMVEGAARAGYFCHDEMFVWARALLSDCPEAARLIRTRFPVVIIDEVQDTSPEQMALLESIFPRNATDVVVQRVGDPNQSIYGVGEEVDVAQAFPDADAVRVRELARSYRFGEGVARLASPFAVRPVIPDGLVGVGPVARGGVLAGGNSSPHAAFVFEPQHASRVIPAFARHAMELFDDNHLRTGVVAAVGGVHRGGSRGVGLDARHPVSVGDYWPEYRASVGVDNRSQDTLLECVFAARQIVAMEGVCAPGVEMIAGAVLRIAERINGFSRWRGRPRRHRTIRELLADHGDIAGRYQKLVRRLVLGQDVLGVSDWESISNEALEIAHVCCGRKGDKNQARALLRWDEDAQGRILCERENAAPNIARVVSGQRVLDVRLGSIHSVKGQTHLATMVLSTFWYEHTFASLLPWLTGEATGGLGGKSRVIRRMRETYVAMTRPTHLLCIAIPRFALGDGEAVQRNLSLLNKRGWRIIDISSSAEG